MVLDGLVAITGIEDKGAFLAPLSILMSSLLGAQ
jgi:hypothetical protein